MTDVVSLSAYGKMAPCPHDVSSAAVNNETKVANTHHPQSRQALHVLLQPNVLLHSTTAKGFFLHPTTPALLARSGLQALPMLPMIIGYPYVCPKSTKLNHTHRQGVLGQEGTDI